MKLNKRYYQNLIEQMSKKLLVEKNKISQILDKELKDYGITYRYVNNDLEINITFKKKHKNKGESDD